MSGETPRSQRRGKTRWQLPLVVAVLLALANPSPTAVVNIKLNGPLVSGGDVREFKISPASNWVIYKADQDTDEAVELYSAPIGGGFSVRLNGPLAQGLSVGEYLISADSQRVVYVADQNTPGVPELFSVPILGPATAATRLNPPTQVGVGSFAITPDGSRVVFQAQDQPSDPGVLYNVPIAGPDSAAVRLTDRAEGSTLTVSAMQLTPDGSRIVFLAGHMGTFNAALYSVPVDGPPSAATRISAIAGVDNLIDAEYKISSDSLHVVFRADFDASANQFSLYSSPVSGPSTGMVQLSTVLPPTALVGIGQFTISPDSSRVVYIGTQTVADESELHSVPIAGPSAAGVKLNKPLPPDGGGVLQARVSADSAWVVYYAAQDSPVIRELYRAPIAGPGSAGEKISDTLAPGENILPDYEVSPVENRVVYRGRLAGSTQIELYSVPLLDPAASRYQLNPDLGSGGNVLGFRLSADGSQVAYRADRIRLFQGDDIFRLWTVPIAGPRGDTVLQGPPPVADGDVSADFAFTPDGSRVVYIADQDTDEVYELYVSEDRPAAAQRWKTYR